MDITGNERIIITETLKHLINTNGKTSTMQVYNTLNKVFPDTGITWNHQRVSRFIHRMYTRKNIKLKCNYKTRYKTYSFKKLNKNYE